MKYFWLILLGLVLLIHGVYSVYTAIKGGPQRSMIFPSTTLVKVFFGEKAQNVVVNLVFGIIEIVFGILMIAGKAN